MHSNMIRYNIRRYRNKKGLTLAEVAKKTGTTKQTISRYESGEISNIPYDRILSLANCFDVTPGHIMGFEKEVDIEKQADMDAELIMLEKRIKEYAIKLSKLSEEDRNDIMKMIDRFGK